MFDVSAAPLSDIDATLITSSSISGSHTVGQAVQASHATQIPVAVVMDRSDSISASFVRSASVSAMYPTLTISGQTTDGVIIQGVHRTSDAVSANAVLSSSINVIMDRGDSTQASFVKQLQIA